MNNLFMVKVQAISAKGRRHSSDDEKDQSTKPASEIDPGDYRAFVTARRGKNEEEKAFPIRDWLTKRSKKS